MRIDKNIVKILLIAIIVKFCYFLFAWFISELIHNFDIYPSVDRFISVFKKNDSYWFEKIVENGYPYSNHSELSNPQLQSVWAFMPLFPGIVKLFGMITGLNYDYSGFIIVFVSSILLFIIFYKWSSDYFKSTEQGFYASLLLMLFPFHYYFSMIYTEALFLLLLICALIFIKKDYLILTAIVLSFMVILRSNGIAILPAVYIFYIEIKYKSITSFYSKIDLKKIIKTTIPFLFPVICFLIWCIYQYSKTGDFFAFSTAQIGWERKLTFPLKSFFHGTEWYYRLNSLYTIAIIILFIIYRKLIPVSFHVFVWISLLLPLMTGSNVSLPRFISVLFPFILILTILMQQVKYRYFILPLLFFLQLFAYYFFLDSHPFSY